MIEKLDKPTKQEECIKRIIETLKDSKPKMK